jgi:hypothetical protein
MCLGPRFGLLQERGRKDSFDFFRIFSSCVTSTRLKIRIRLIFSSKLMQMRTNLLCLQDTRTHAVGELYDTERSYVESLQILVTVC